MRLTCLCGHSWTHTGSSQVPSDVRLVCPVCTAAEVGTRDMPALTPGLGGRPAAAPADLSPVPGYQILDEINRGGMGVIYRARQLGLNRIVALKVILPNRTGAADALKRFQREVEAAARLSHPNIVTVYHTDLDGPRPYLAMEYVDGIDLHRLVTLAGPLSPADACYYVLEAANGLQHAFEQGLVHRDIKPANLIVTPSPLVPAARHHTGRLPRVKILDMGLARITDPGDAGGPQSDGGGLTQAGEFLGTPDFMAPEQAEDSRRADTRSDLYSLGGTLFFLLTGRLPFPGGNFAQKLRRQLTGRPPAVSAHRPEIGRGFDEVVGRLLAPDPADRYQTPAELVAALHELVATDRITGPASSGVVPRAATVRPSPGSGGRGGPVSAAPSSHGAAGAVRAHDGGVQGLALTPDGKQVLSGGLDGRLRVWTADRLAAVRTVTSNAGPVEQVRVAPSGKWAATCALQLDPALMGVQLWDLGTGAPGRRLTGPADNALCVAVAADGRQVAAGAADGSVWVWTVTARGAEQVRVGGHGGRVTAVLFPGAKGLLLSAGEDGTVRQWDVDAARPKGVIAVPVGRVAGVAVHGRTRRLAAAGADGLAVRHPDGTVTEFLGHAGPVDCVAFLADGERVVSGGEDGTVRVWRAADGTQVTSLTGHSAPVHCLTTDPAGAIFSGGRDGTLRRWTAPA